tara:strand:- start:19550 stop:20293 length:744 start_codon:yes stop_codon:yes gene_type:complete
MSHIKQIIKTFTLGTIFSLTIACTSTPQNEIYRENPDQRLDKLMVLYELAQSRGEGCHEIWRANNATVDCQRILNEIEKLYLEFPNHERVLLSNAIINFEMNKSDDAEWFLDQLALFQRANPEAAILRAEIAIRSGNLKFADSLIERQILLQPSDSGLREVKASIAYLNNDFEASRKELSVAGRLGAPSWRLAYHHGLVSESQVQWGQACKFYQAALDQKPDFQAALSRLIGLIDNIDCADAIEYIR